MRSWKRLGKRKEIQVDRRKGHGQPCPFSFAPVGNSPGQVWHHFGGEVRRGRRASAKPSVERNPGSPASRVREFCRAVGVLKSDAPRTASTADSGTDERSRCPAVLYPADSAAPAD